MMRALTGWKWRAYGALVLALSALHYAVLSRFSSGDEGGLAWFRRRLNPVLPPPSGAKRIWIHAVSAGEAKVAELLRGAIQQQAPGVSVVLSATTYSGFERVRKVAGDAASFIMPLDTPRAQTRLFAEVKPHLMVLVESEYWPAQFAMAEAAGVPVAVVNATMSERSFGRHSRNPRVARRTLLTARRIYAQDEVAKGRYAALGVAPDRLALSGNIKLAGLRVPEPGERPARVVFGNVHRVELQALGPAVKALRTLRSNLQIVLVPRYPGRIPQAELLAAFGDDLRVTENIDGADFAGAPVWVDRMGVLAGLYATARVGVVCGTFGPIGGHDLSEPLQQGAASLYGPHTERQRALDDLLGAIGAGEKVTDAAALLAAILRLVDDGAERARRLSAAARAAEAARLRLQEIAAELVDMAG
jgi:3-deoxy-D-manno-octulosonic-acid transferase